MGRGKFLKKATFFSDPRRCLSDCGDVLRLQIGASTHDAEQGRLPCTLAAPARLLVRHEEQSIVGPARSGDWIRETELPPSVVRTCANHLRSRAWLVVDPESP